MTKTSRKRRMRKHLGSLAILGIVLCLLLIVSFSSLKLQVKNDTNQAKIEELEALIADEEARTKEIEEYGKYVQTKKYVEEVAKEKLGLVYKDEIIFKAEN